MLKSLNIQQLSADLQLSTALQCSNAAGAKAGTGSCRQARTAAGARKAAPVTVAVQPMRKSARQRGLDIDACQPEAAPAQRLPFQDIDENAGGLTTMTTIIHLPFIAACPCASWHCACRLIRLLWRDNQEQHRSCSAPISDTVSCSNADTGGVPQTFTAAR